MITASNAKGLAWRVEANNAFTDHRSSLQLIPCGYVRQQLKDSRLKLEMAVVGDRGASRSLLPEIGYTRGSANSRERHIVPLIGFSCQR
jgi:hypothetical protein